MRPFRVELLSGFRFCIVFADPYMKFVFVDLLKAKSEALASLKKFVLSVGKPKKLRQDDAKEFLSEQFKMYCLDAGILQEKTIPETLQQNVLAERCNRTLLEMARCLLIDSGLPKMLWGATILHATRIRNLVVRREEKCPAELMRIIKPKFWIGELSYFGCTVFMRKRDSDVSKLETKALEGKFVGYTEGDNGYLVYVPNTRKVVAVRDVMIKESEVGSIPDNKETPDLLDEGSQQLGILHPDDGHQDDGNKEKQGTSTAMKEEWHYAESVKTPEKTMRRDASDIEEAALEEESTATRGSLRDSGSLEDSETEDFSQTFGFFEEALEQADRAEPRRRSRARNFSQFLWKVRTHLAVTEGDYVEPRTVYAAKQGNDWDHWHREMKDEVKALQDNETWNLVRQPTDRDVIPGKWVYKVKLRPSGQVDKYKARYVAKNFKQVEGLDYFVTFAPTCEPETFRILLQLSAKHGYVMHHFEVKTAFLDSPIEEEVYLEQPQEFVKQGSHGENLLRRLNLSIYGLKHAANNWYMELAKFLPRQWSTRSRNDHSLFARTETVGQTITLVSVDDIIVASKSMTVISDLKKAPEATFHMEDRGQLHWFLGLRIGREEGKITVDQERYMETMLEQFQMDQCKPSRTPADLNLKLQTIQNGHEEVH